MEMEKILNLTQHLASPEQIEAGVIEPANKEKIQELLTFVDLPTNIDIKSRAKTLTAIAMYSHCNRVLIGGAPYLITILSNELKKCGIIPIHAFTKRTVIEKDGKKISIFQHLGFIQD